jgi:tripartite-type tricarboxylate transporter receptor subunit TctC
MIAACSPQGAQRIQRPHFGTLARGSQSPDSISFIRAAFTVMLVHAFAYAVAADYPSRPIRLVVPWPAGGGADTVGRAMAQDLTVALGQQVVVDNRPGAAGIIGSELVARAPSDGYTLLLPTVTAAINPHLHRKLSYDTVKDFEPVILLASAPYLLAINPSVAARSVPELVALAKTKPRQLNFASTGNGSAPHLTGEWFNQASGTSFVHIPYKGGPPVLTDLIGGHVQMAFGNIVNYLPQARAGKLRALAVTSAQRTPQAPELPTMIESGLPGFVSGTWFGVQTPARTPPAIIGQLNRALNGLLAGQLPRQLANEGADPIGGTPGEFADYMQSELARWSEVIRAANIKVE